MARFVLAKLNASFAAVGSLLPPTRDEDVVCRRRGTVRRLKLRAAMPFVGVLWDFYAISLTRLGSSPDDLLEMQLASPAFSMHVTRGSSVAYPVGGGGGISGAAKPSRQAKGTELPSGSLDFTTPAAGRPAYEQDYSQLEAPRDERAPHLASG